MRAARALTVAIATLAALGGASTAAAPGPSTVGEGRSALGRPIVVEQIGDVRAATRVLVFGTVHGDETAGIAIADRLARLVAPSGVALWIVRDLNPDGRAAGTRQNARGVDLNRNFPYRWRRLGRRGDQQFAGTAPLSEPESRFAARVVTAVDPSITIWFHQPLATVDLSGGDATVERRFARLAHLPIRRLARYPGSATGWQNHDHPLRAAFVVELGPGPLAPRRALALARAVLDLARTQPRRGGRPGRR